MTEKLRSEMGKSAVDAAKAVGYVGAGTVEFIVDADTDEYFFMEMNTRLQVEHPVTEMIMQMDLVQLQLHVAAGHKLMFTQDDIKSFGHAIEARIYSEDPRNNFLPGSGRLDYLSIPMNNSPSGVRIESGVRQGDEVSIFYDPMIAKLIVWDSDRTKALKKLKSSLMDYKIAGLPTNIEFLQAACSHHSYIDGNVDTTFIPVRD